MTECQPLHIFTIQQQFLWTSFSRCCQFFTFLSLCSLCLHGSLHVCGACRREGQSGRRRAHRGFTSQFHNTGDLQSPNPVILTRCSDPSPLQAAAQADQHQTWLSFFLFSFLYLSNFFFKNTRLRSELIIGMCGAWKLHTIVQRDHNCICVCVSVHMCNGECALTAKKQLLKWLIRQIA